jgi:hypothetical protein
MGERPHGKFEVFFLCIFDLVVADSLKGLNEHHYRGNPCPRYFRSVVERAGRQTVRQLNRLSADPGLNSEPAAYRQSSQQSKQIGATHSEGGAYKHWKRNVVLPCVRV